ncbi:hypothetical protein GQ55_2G001300 [Panicum hallii var. hallii]|uniref:Uncharacterized protein n=1 Tax=Panicum hallii var. hallii TaxID=1504633 RepID=A0A2T7EK00_9POAL|nr:hypothetical protein GQ55_2G001300 [Panicum hallii var. hallii]
MNRAQRSSQVSASAPPEPEPDPSQLQDASRGVWMRVPCFQVLGNDLMRCEGLTSRLVWV